MNVLYNMKKLKSRMQNRGWISSDILPTESGDYLCLTKSEYGITAVYHYSEKHKAFNAYDSVANDHEISVAYWRPLPKGVKRAKRDWKQIANKAFGALVYALYMGVLFMGCLSITVLLKTFCPVWVAWAWVGLELSAVAYIVYMMWKGEKNDSE